MALASLEAHITETYQCSIFTHSNIASKARRKMSFLTDEEKNSLSIRRMIFHVVGKTLDDPILLEEITPPQHSDFFLERVKSALKGNLFEFRQRSTTEQCLRNIRVDRNSFTIESQNLASDFQTHHSGTTSTGVFFVFELGTGAAEGRTIYALIKYDNEDVVRYVLDENGRAQVPRLERFQESFVRKAEAMQKIALVSLEADEGGSLIVRDRSNPAHISDYFEGFLQARRVNSPADLSQKLVEAFKQTFKDHRSTLPQDVQRSGVNRIFDVLRQGGHRFDPDDCEALIVAIFGQVPENSPLRKTLKRKLKENGVSEETFDIDPQQIQQPSRRRLETAEGVQITFNVDNRPEIKDRDDGRKEIVIITSQITRDDVDTEKNPRGN